MRVKTKQKSYFLKKSLFDHITVNAVKQATKTAREQLDESWHQTAYCFFQTVCIYSCRIGCKIKVSFVLFFLFFPVRMESEQWQLVPVTMIRDPCVLNRLRVISHRIWTCCAPVSNLRAMTAPSQHETVAADKYGQSRGSHAFFSSSTHFLLSLLFTLRLQLAIKLMPHSSHRGPVNQHTCTRTEQVSQGGHGAAHTLTHTYIYTHTHTRSSLWHEWKAASSSFLTWKGALLTSPS